MLPLQSYRSQSLCAAVKERTGNSLQARRVCPEPAWDSGQVMRETAVWAPTAALEIVAACSLTCRMPPWESNNENNVHKFYMPHNSDTGTGVTIHKENPTRCNSVSIFLFHIYTKFNVFWATRCPSSGADNCTSSLWHTWRVVGSVVAGRCQVEYTLTDAHHQEPKTALAASGFAYV